MIAPCRDEALVKTFERVFECRLEQRVQTAVSNVE